MTTTTRVVVWGGPLHDQVLDVPTKSDGGPPSVYLAELDTWDVHVDGRKDPIGQRASRVTYRALRLADAPGSPLARDRREPPWWFVYVPDDAPVSRRQWYLDQSRTPVVDGPVKPHPVLVGRGRRLAAPEHDVVPPAVTPPG